jgi:hypothetical protein
MKNTKKRGWTKFGQTLYPTEKEEMRTLPGLTNLLKGILKVHLGLRVLVFVYIPIERILLSFTIL